MRNYDIDYLRRIYEFACNRYRLAAADGDASAQGRWLTAARAFRRQLRELDFITLQCLGVQTTAR